MLVSFFSLLELWTYKLNECWLAAFRREACLQRKKDEEDPEKRSDSRQWGLRENLFMGSWFLSSMRPSFMVSPSVLRDTSRNSPLSIACANLGICSLPPRHQQYEKMVVAMSWPKTAPMPTDETSQRYFLITHFNLGDVCAMSLNSVSHLGMPVKREVGEDAAQFDGSPKPALNKSSPCLPALCPTISHPTLCRSTQDATWRGREPIVQMIWLRLRA